MADLVFKVYIDGNFFNTFQNKEIKDFFIDWDDKLKEGQIIQSKEGKVKVITASIENPKQNKGNMVTEIKLEKL